MQASDDGTSIISGAGAGAGKKRKRRADAGEKRARGRPPKNPPAAGRASSASIVNGDDARSTTTATRRGGTAGAASVVAGGGDGEEDEDDEDDDDARGPGGRGGADEGFSLDPAEMDREKQRRTLFRETVPPAHQNRYDAFNKAKLRTQDIRRLVNATLSQSVPPGVTIVVGAYTKMFAGLLIEAAREVQAEWMATEVNRPDEVENQAYKRLRLTQPTEPDSVVDVESEAEVEAKVDIKKEEDLDSADREELPDSNTTTGADDQDSRPGDTQPSSDSKTTIKAANAEDQSFDDSVVQPGAWGISKYVNELDRGPLLPDHLREALRRYKKSRSGGSVGFTGLSLQGREVAAPRMGGRRLFK